MSKVSKLQYINKDFSLRNREATALRISLLAWRDNLASLKRGEISDKANFTNVKKNVRREYPEFTPDQLRLAQDNICDWFGKNKHLSEFDPFRARFPKVFEDQPFKQAEILFDTVETDTLETVAEKSPEEVETVRHYQQMGAKQIETPSGFKIQF